MFKLLRVSRATTGRAIPRHVAQPAHRLYSSENTTNATPDSKTTTTAASETTATDAAPKSTPTPTPAQSTSTSKPAANGNGATASKTNGRSAPTSRSKPAVTTAPAKPQPPVHANGTKYPPSTPPGPGGLPYYQPKTIVFAEPPAPGRTVVHSKDMDVDWENSYHGVATRPVTAEQFKVLMEPIPEQDIEVKPDGVIYLPEIKYRRRLNEAFGPMGWGLVPRSEPTLANGIATREYALIVGGRFVAQAQGENTYFNPEGMPAAVEGCKSNALMRCCKDLGIASELWDPVFIRLYKQRFMQEIWVEHVTTKKKRQLWFKAGQVNVPYPWKKV